MLAITVKGLWAWAMFHAGKDVENRDWHWPDTINLPCRLLIHASRYETRFEYDIAHNCITAVADVVPPAYADVPRGCIVGAITVSDCVIDSESLWFGGRYGFLLRAPVSLPHVVPCAGSRRIWTVPRDVEDEVRALARRL